MNDDFLDLLGAFGDANVRFLLVGAHAVAAHGVPRATGDLDVWVQADAANAERVWQALATFGAPVEALGVAVEDFATVGNVVQLGQPPRRIDVLTSIDGADFASAWDRRIVATVGDCSMPVLSYRDLLRNKRATARPKDVQDVLMLEQAQGRRQP